MHPNSGHPQPHGTPGPALGCRSPQSPGSSPCSPASARAVPESRAKPRLRIYSSSREPRYITETDGAVREASPRSALRFMET